MTLTKQPTLVVCSPELTCLSSRRARCCCQVSDFVVGSGSETQIFTSGTCDFSFGDNFIRRGWRSFAPMIRFFADFTSLNGFEITIDKRPVDVHGFYLVYCWAAA